jgi:hypothetical protein
MGILKGLLKVGLSPLNGVAEIVKDLAGANGEDKQGLSILTVGVSSVVKGTAKGVVDCVDEIFN